MTEKFEKASFQILSHEDALSFRMVRRVGKYNYIAQRLLYWFCLFKRKKQAYWLMENYHSSPFLRNERGFNVLHKLSMKKGLDDMLCLLCLPTYKFYRPRWRYAEFDKEKAINLRMKDFKNNLLHLNAIINNNSVFNFLVEKGVKFN